MVSNVCSDARRVTERVISADVQMCRYTCHVWRLAVLFPKHLSSPSNTHIAVTNTTSSYGTTFAALTQLHPKRCILDIDLQGVKQLHLQGPKQSPPLVPVFLFLSPPSVSHLKSRLSGRGTETDESIGKRLAAAKAEIEHAISGAHDLVIVNDDLERAGKMLEQVALGSDGWEKVGDELPALDVSEL